MSARNGLLCGGASECKEWRTGVGRLRDSSHYFGNELTRATSRYTTGRGYYSIALTLVKCATHLTAFATEPGEWPWCPEDAGKYEGCGVHLPRGAIGTR